MLVFLGLGVFIVTVALVPLAAHVLNKRGLLDHPIDRSSHELPTPRGAGLVIMPMIFAVWGFLFWRGDYTWPTAAVDWSILLCGIFLCACTWIDDHKVDGLRVRTRLLIQFIAVIIPLYMWPAEGGGRLFPETMPLLVERILMALAWVWFMNLYNFIDGINGIAAMHTVSICGGLLIYCFFSNASVPAGYEALVVVPLAAAAGFYLWNGRRKALIFLGDVGSIGLGYVLAWLLFVFAARGYFVPAAIVAFMCSYDPTITLLKRAWQKKKIWQGHREFFFHRATVKGGLSHLQCVGIIFVMNIIMIVLGLLALHGKIRPYTAFLVGTALSWALLTVFFWIGKAAGHQSSPRPKAFYIERYLRYLFKRMK